LEETARSQRGALEALAKQAKEAEAYWPSV